MIEEIEEIKVSHTIIKVSDDKWALLLHVGDRKVRLKDFNKNPPVGEIKAVLDIARTCFSIFNGL